MALRLPQSNFSRGELADELLGRFDVSAYAAACQRARNVTILKYGGVTKRPGTRFVAEVFDASRPVRLLPFQFSIDQAYALEFGQGYMRPAALGGMVLQEELAITNITNAAQARITAAYHGYSVGDQLYLNGVSGMTQANRRTVKVVSVIDQNNFTVDLNTSTFGAFAGSTGGITRAAPPAPDPVPPVVPPVVEPPEPPPVSTPWNPRPNLQPY